MNSVYWASSWLGVIFPVHHLKVLRHPCIKTMISQNTCHSVMLATHTFILLGKCVRLKFSILENIYVCVFTKICTQQDAWLMEVRYSKSAQGQASVAAADVKDWSPIRSIPHTGPSKTKHCMVIEIRNTAQRHEKGYCSGFTVSLS